MQVYMLKAEGIAFRFLPDPLQIKNALEVCSLIVFFPLVALLSCTWNYLYSTPSSLYDVSIIEMHQSDCKCS